MSGMQFRFVMLQTLTAVAVAWFAIYCGVDNGYLVAAYGFMGAFAITCTAAKVADCVAAYRNGLPLPLPPAGTILYVSAVTAGATVGILCLGTVLVLIDLRFHLF